MGMDMYWAKQPEHMKAAHEEARAEFFTRCNERDEIPKEEAGRKTFEELRANPDAPARDATERYKAAQRAVNEAHKKMYEVEEYYFRLNWWGMSRFLNAMLGFGMAYPSENEADWPTYRDDLPGFEDAVEAIEEGMKPDCSSDVEAIAMTYVHERDRIVQAHPGTEKGIPSHKFSSNDGWWVTPEECRAALAAYEKNASMKELILADAGIADAAYWDKWIKFIRGAADHDGFKVH